MSRMFSNFVVVSSSILRPHLTPQTVTSGKPFATYGQRFIGPRTMSFQAFTTVCEQVALDQSLPHVVTANETETLLTGTRAKCRPCLAARCACLATPIGSLLRWTLSASGHWVRRTNITNPRCALRYVMRGRGVTQQQASALSCDGYSGPSSKSEMGSLCNKMRAVTLDTRANGGRRGLSQRRREQGRGEFRCPASRRATQDLNEKPAAGRRIRFC